MPQRLSIVLGVLVLGASSLAAQSLTIDHSAVGCVVAERFPRLEARFDPRDALAKAQVLFQPENGRHWYAVAMTGEGPAFCGVLPKPKKSLKAFRYYIEATDKTLGTSRTAEYTASVVAGAAGCQDKMMAGALGSASVTLEVPAGAPSVPVGFSSTGVTAVGAAATAATVGAAAAGAAAAGTTAATGGGVSTTLLVVGGLVAAAGGAAAIAAAAGGSDEIVHPGFVYVGECTCGPISRPPPYSYATGGPIQGAVASTDLNADTATTDAQGHFELRTSEPSGRGFTISVTAPGCTTSTWRGGYGTNPTSHVTLVCSGGLPPRTSACSCASQ